MLENAAIESNLSDTAGNIFNFDESALPITNKHASVMTGKWSKIVCVLTSGENFW